MDKNKKKIIKFSAIVSSPVVLSIVLVVIKYAVCRAIPFWVALAPIWFVILALVAIVLLTRYYMWRGQVLHRRKCCGNCCHCMEDIFYDGKGKCLVTGKEIDHLARQSCNRFLGSIMKGYKG